MYSPAVGSQEGSASYEGGIPVPTLLSFLTPVKRRYSAPELSGLAPQRRQLNADMRAWMQDLVAARDAQTDSGRQNPRETIRRYSASELSGSATASALGAPTLPPGSSFACTISRRVRI